MRNLPAKTAGFTLVELMTIVVVITILISIALPSYRNQVIKSKRSLGRAELMQVMARQEQFFVNNRQYAASLDAFGFSDPYAIDANGNAVLTSASDRIYEIQLVSATAISYTLRAIPQLGQAHDELCGSLQITSSGVKSETGSGAADDCW